LALAIAMLYAVAKNMCPHRNATETASSRMGLHEYKCNDCGAYFGIDSSD
jgi:transposase-like protein